MIEQRVASQSALIRDDFAEPSVFLPENLLRESRRQRALPPGPVPDICLLDPDGDIVNHVVESGLAVRSASWACYHTDLYEIEASETRIGIIGRAVGAPYAVLVAEQLFASGCKVLISVTSAGQVAPDLELPALILIDQALRGDGTSHCYLPPADFVDADPSLLNAAGSALDAAGIAFRRGPTWTTDAPFRETEISLARAAAAGVLAVEMEAAGLYAFSKARGYPVVCLAHVTNQLAKEGDFEKGPDAGVARALAIASAIGLGWIG